MVVPAVAFMESRDQKRDLPSSPVLPVHLEMIFFLRFIYLFLEREEGREKEEERNISVWLPLVYPVLGTWAATQACALTGY